MQERDRLIHELPEEQRTKLFIAIPTPMKAWMELWHEENIMHPEYSVLVMTGTLNPEPVYFYQRHDYRFLQGMPKLDMELVETCEPKDEATVD